MRADTAITRRCARSGCEDEMKILMNSAEGWQAVEPKTHQNEAALRELLKDTLLDVGDPADYYLVLRGPRAGSAKGPRTLPFLIDAVYPFEMVAFRQALTETGVKVGIATSVRWTAWDQAQVYPDTPAEPTKLTPEQVARLQRFAGDS